MENDLFFFDELDQFVNKEHSAPTQPACGLDLNDPKILSLYTTLVCFQDNTSHKELIFLDVDKADQRSLRLLAQMLGLIYDESSQPPHILISRFVPNFFPSPATDELPPRDKSSFYHLPIEQRFVSEKYESALNSCFPDMFLGDLTYNLVQIPVDTGSYLRPDIDELPPRLGCEQSFSSSQFGDLFLSNDLQLDSSLQGSCSSNNTNEIFHLTRDPSDMDIAYDVSLTLERSSQLADNHQFPPESIPSKPIPIPTKFTFVEDPSAVPRKRLNNSDASFDDEISSAKVLRGIGACWKCKILRKRCNLATPCECCLRSDVSSPWKRIGCKRGLIKRYIPRISLCPAKQEIPRHFLEHNLSKPPPSDPSNTTYEYAKPSRASKITRKAPNLSLIVEDIFNLTRDMQRIYSAGCFRVILQPTGLYDANFSDLLDLSVQVYKSSISASIIRKSLECLRDCLTAMRSSIVHCGRVHDKCSTNCCQNSWTRTLEQSFAECIEASSCEMLRKRKPDDKNWLPTFCSLCLQVYIGKAVTVVQSDTSESGQFCRSPIYSYLALAIQLFDAISADYDSIMDPNIDSSLVKEKIAQMLQRNHVDSSILYLRSLFEGPNECAGLPRSWPLCENALRRLCSRSEPTNEICHQKSFGRERHSGRHNPSERAVRDKNDLSSFNSNVNTNMEAGLTDAPAVKQEFEINDILGIANLNLVTNRDCSCSADRLQSAAIVDRKLWSFGVQRELELVEILRLPGRRISTCDRGTSP